MSRRRRTGSRSLSLFGIVAVGGMIVILIAHGAVASTTFTSVFVPRSGSINSVSDTEGVVSLHTESAVQRNNPQPEPFVHVANYASPDPISVTISLESGNDGELIGPYESSTGNAITFDVANGQNATVEIDTSFGAPNGGYITFDVDVQGTGIGATLHDREVYSSNTGNPYTGPTARFWGIGFGSTCTLRAGLSTPQDRIVSYEWDFDGDGTYDDTTTSSQVSHTYGGDTPNPTLRVTDDLGMTDTGTILFTVGGACG